MPNENGTALSSTIQFDMDEVHELSVDLLSYMEEDGVAQQTACVALALTLGRLMSPQKPLGEDKSVQFIQSALEFAALFFATGRTH